MTYAEEILGIIERREMKAEPKVYWNADKSGYLMGNCTLHLTVSEMIVLMESLLAYVNLDVPVRGRKECAVKMWSEISKRMADLSDEVERRWKDEKVEKDV